MVSVQHLTSWATPRRLAAFVLLSVSLLMLFPFSLHFGAPEAKDLTEPFPCQDRTCGCRTAAQCWKKCCCFSDSQKVAWAKSHGVRVPGFVVAAAKQEIRREKTLCKSSGSCCLKVAELPVRSVRQRAQLVVGLDALRCSGVEMTLAGQLISIQPPPSLEIVSGDVCSGELLLLSVSPLAPIEQEPPTPPPRLGVA